MSDPTNPFDLANSAGVTNPNSPLYENEEGGETTKMTLRDWLLGGLFAALVAGGVIALMLAMSHT